MSVRDRPSPLNKFPAAGSFQRRTEIGELAVLFSVYSAVRRGGKLELSCKLRRVYTILAFSAQHISFILCYH